MKELIITGNAGSDAIRRTSQAGKEFVIFSVAHYEGKTKDGNEIPSTWVEVRLPSDHFLAQYVMNNVKKGVKVLVRGRNKISVYTTKQGTLAYSETVFADKVEALSFEKKAVESTDTPDPRQEQNTSLDYAENAEASIHDDIPFQ